MARAGIGTLDNTILQPGKNFYVEPRTFVTTLLLETWPVHPMLQTMSSVML